MKIRSAEEADRPIIARLHADSWRDAYREYLSPGYYADLDQRLGRHWQELEIGVRDILLLAEGEEPLGFLFARDGDPAFINTLHVLPGLRSRGTGAALMAEAARRMQEAGRTSAYLDVITGNQRAIAFYQRLGGVTGTVKEKLVGDRMVPNLRIDFPDLAIIIAAA